MAGAGLREAAKLWDFGTMRARMIRLSQPLVPSPPLPSYSEAVAGKLLQRKLPAVQDGQRLRGPAGAVAHGLHLHHNVHALQHLAKHHVLAVQPAGGWVGGALRVCPMLTAQQHGMGRACGTTIVPSSCSPPSEHPPAGDDGGDEELRAVRVLARIGHRQVARRCVLEGKVLVLQGTIHRPMDESDFAARHTLMHPHFLPAPKG